MVALLKEFYGRGPTRTKSYFEDDLVVCVLRGGFSRVEQCLLDAREAAAQHADHQVVLEVGLRSGRAAAVELLQQGDHPVRDRRQRIAMRLRLVLDDFWVHSGAVVLADGADVW